MGVFASIKQALGLTKPSSFAIVPEVSEPKELLELRGQLRQALAVNAASHRIVNRVAAHSSERACSVNAVLSKMVKELHKDD